MVATWITPKARKGLTSSIAGEELTTDYALFDDYEAEMVCSCGTSRRRGTIGGRDGRRRDLQERYRGHFSWYLQRQIDQNTVGDALGQRPVPGAAGQHRRQR